MNSAKYREIFDENLLQSAHGLILRQRFTFQQNNNPKHTAKTMLEWLWDNFLHVLQWPSQSPNMNPTEHLIFTLSLWVIMCILIAKRLYLIYFKLNLEHNKPKTEATENHLKPL